jgi:hypothetical protein
LPAVVERFRAHRAAMNAIIDNDERLGARRASAHAYLDQFFAILDNPAQYNSQIVEHCRGPA